MTQWLLLALVKVSVPPLQRSVQQMKHLLADERSNRQQLETALQRFVGEEKDMS